MRPARLGHALALAAMAAVIVTGPSAAAKPSAPVRAPAGPSAKPGAGLPPKLGQSDQCALQPGDHFDRGYLANERKAEAAARVMERWLARHPRARKALAGRWYSVSSHHGAYHLTFTRDAGAYQAAMRKVAPDPARVCAGPALYTRAELNAAQAVVERELPWLERHGVAWVEIGVDEVTNTLVIGISEDSSGDAAQLLRRRYGGTVPMRVEFSAPIVALSVLD